MPHQLDALRACGAGREFFAYFMDQGTGKTWTLLADAEREFAAGRIDGLLVLAPNGVHTNWTRREIPMHMSVPFIAASYSSGGGKAQDAALARLFAPREKDAPVPLRILTMAIDALVTERAMDLARRFLRVTRAMMALDESTRIKNVASLRHKRALALRPFAAAARIATGMPIPQSPLDLFGQMEFLRNGLLGTTSYRAFVAEHADLVDMKEMPNVVRRSPKAAFAQIVAKDENGNPRYRNIDRLTARVANHAFRIRKEQCLALPPKVYQQLTFRLAPVQQRAYNTLKEDLRIIIGDQMFPVKALAALTKLQQVTSGFAIVNGEPQSIADGNPRLSLLLELLEDEPGSVIVWARFREELRTIAAALRGKRRVVGYHGGTSEADRNAAVDAFQSGEADLFLGQPQSGGIGLTLTAAQTVVYFSNDFNLETRVQSEDRAHRIGTQHSVRYIDLIAEGTVDHGIVRSLRRKRSLGAGVLADLEKPSEELGVERNFG